MIPDKYVRYGKRELVLCMQRALYLWYEINALPNIVRVHQVYMSATLAILLTTGTFLPGTCGTMNIQH